MTGNFIFQTLIYKICMKKCCLLGSMHMRRDVGYFKTQWTAFLMFCNFYMLNPFTVNVDVLCTYAQFLSRTFKSAQSIRNYLNGVRILFLLHDCNIDIFSSFEIKLTLRGLDRKLKHSPRQALPITIDILDKFHTFFYMNNPCDITF
jgi:hypothetical protein